MCILDVLLIQRITRFFDQGDTNFPQIFEEMNFSSVINNNIPPGYTVSRKLEKSWRAKDLTHLHSLFGARTVLTTGGGENVPFSHGAQKSDRLNIFSQVF